MDFLITVMWGWAFAASLMLILFLYERVVRDASIVDVGWSGAIGFLVLGYCLFSEAPLGRKALVGLMGGMWSLRLTFYLFLNRVYRKPEDGRYRTLREDWGEHSGLNFFLFFQFQAILSVVFSIPFLLALSERSETLSFFEWAALPLWLIAVIGESLSDLQLAGFRAHPSNCGKVCQVGLWKYSRHPNYFFEWLHWWTYAVMGIGHWWGGVNLLFPLVMAFFLFKLTGIPATESHALESRGEAYRQYQRTTSRFFPWFPRETPS